MAGGRLMHPLDATRRECGYHEIIGNRGEFAEIQKGDVFGLFIVGQPGTGLCEQFGFHVKKGGPSWLLFKLSHLPEPKPSRPFVNRKLAGSLPRACDFSPIVLNSGTARTVLVKCLAKCKR